MQHNVLMLHPVACLHFKRCTAPCCSPLAPQALVPPVLSCIASLSEAQDSFVAVVRASRDQRRGSITTSASRRASMSTTPMLAEGAPDRRSLSGTALRQPLLDPDSEAQQPASAQPVADGPAAALSPRAGTAATPTARRQPPGATAAAPGDAGTVACALAAAAALLWPSALAAPWMVAVCVGLMVWALRLQPRPGAPQLRLLQAYSGACVVLLYCFQLGLLAGPGPAVPPKVSAAITLAGRVLGLYRLAWDTPQYSLVPQLLHLAALAGLYTALSVAVAAAVRAAASGSGPGVLPHQRVHTTQQQQQQPWQLRRAPRRSSGLAAAVSAVAWAVDGLCRHPSCAAAALCCLSMGEVSVLGGVALLLGMWTLLARSR